MYIRHNPEKSKFLRNLKNSLSHTNTLTYHLPCLVVYIKQCQELLIPDLSGSWRYMKFFLKKQIVHFCRRRTVYLDHLLNLKDIVSWD